MRTEGSGGSMSRTCPCGAWTEPVVNLSVSGYAPSEILRGSDQRDSTGRVILAAPGREASRCTRHVDGGVQRYPGSTEEREGGPGRWTGQGEHHLSEREW